MTVLHAVLLAARLLLAGVFALAGVTKLLHRAGSRQALVDFGVPRSLAAPAGVILPLAELAVALALIPQATALYGAIGALALLIIFTAGIGANLARGFTPDCHCFGQLHSAPVGWTTLARNSALAAAAGFVVFAGHADPGPGVIGWLVTLTAPERFGVLTGIALLAAQSALLLRVLRQNDKLRRQLASSSSAAAVEQDSPAAPPIPLKGGRPVGTVAPDFALESLDGGMVTLEGLRAGGKPVLLFFSNPGCASCRALLPEISQWQRDHRDAFTLVVVSGGTPEANRAKLGGHGVTNVLLQHKREVAKAYDAAATPGAVVVVPEGTIGSPLARGDVEIRALVTEWADRAKRTDTPPPPAPAPGFMLPNLEGQPVTLEQFRGKPTLVLFWNPACGFCRRMLGDLKAWEARPLAERTHLLVISTGTAVDNRALGLNSTILLDPESAARQEYGLPGTPSAALVDSTGHLLEKVVGASAILGLVGQPEARRDKPMVSTTKGTENGRRAAPIATLPADAKPLKHQCVQDELLSDGSMVLYNSCRRQVLTLNPTAALVWECCDGEHPIDEIAAEVREVFPAAADAERDVRDVLDRLLQASMITSAAASTAPSAGFTSMSERLT